MNAGAAMNPWLLLLFLAAAFCLCVGVSRWLLPTLLSRGEVAGVPEVEDIPQAKSLDEAGCWVNASPHRCAGDQHVFPKRPPDYPTTPAERRFADDIETFLKEIAR